MPYLILLSFLDTFRVTSALFIFMLNQPIRNGMPDVTNQESAVLQARRSGAAIPNEENELSFPKRPDQLWGPSSLLDSLDGEVRVASRGQQICISCVPRCQPHARRVASRG